MWRIVGWLITPFLQLLFRWPRLSRSARTLGIIWTIGIVIIVVGLAQSMPQDSGGTVDTVGTPTSDQYDVKLIFPVDRYPETADHIQDAIAKGESSICTIDRNGSVEHREASLAGIPTRKGYDRDEWPMAMCAEGGAGADIRYVTPSDNRGAGSWIGGQLNDYADGTRVWIVIDHTEAANEIGSDLDVVSHAGSTPGGTSEAVSSAAGSSKNTTTGAGTEKSNTDSNTSSTNANDTSSNKTNSTAQPSVESNVSSTPASNNTKTEVVYKNCTDVRAAGAAPLHKDDPGYSRKLDRDGDGVACE